MINLAGLGRTMAATAIILSAVMVPALRAQDVTDEQVKAARAAIEAVGATNGFDNILPNLAERLKTTLIQSSPALWQDSQEMPATGCLLLSFCCTV